MEGMMRGFTFKDFLEKNIYAIPFNNKRNNELTYSLVTSVDYARKIGMRSGVVGKSAPTFVEDEKGNIISCTVTIKRKVNEYVGDYTATVFFKEYNTGYQQWATKPHTMIAKVAEMHALRMACPEEMSQMYVEEEMQEPAQVVVTVDVKTYEKELRAAKTVQELKQTWIQLPPAAKKELTDLVNELKKKLEEPNDNKKV
jgi:hypothetical protein